MNQSSGFLDLFLGALSWLFSSQIFDEKIWYSWKTKKSFYQLSYIFMSIKSISLECSTKLMWTVMIFMNRENLKWFFVVNYLNSMYPLVIFRCRGFKFVFILQRKYNDSWTVYRILAFRLSWFSLISRLTEAGGSIKAGTCYKIHRFFRSTLLN